MRFEKLERVFKSNGYDLKDVNGRIRTPKQFEKACFDYGIQIDRNELNDEYSICCKELIEHSFKKKVELTPLELVLQEIDANEVFKDFEICDDGSSNHIVRYVNPDTKIKTVLGTIADLDAKYLTIFLGSTGIETLETWMKTLDPIKHYLKLQYLTPEIAVDNILNLFGNFHKIKRKQFDFKAATVALEGSNAPADYIIPFLKKHSTLDDLNPILRSFLERTTDHKYLCAIIASRLLNFKHSYTPYLYGGGGDGKSTFINFLNMLVNNQTATLKPEAGNFGLYNCIGKVFLMVNDTNTKHVFAFETIKQISGYDKVSVESKYKNPKDIYLPGMIIITSNRMPEIYNEDWFRRRARIFPITGLRQVKEGKGVLDALTAVEEMYKSANEFLNYAIQCLEEVGNIETGEVPRHPYLISAFTNTVSSQEMAQKDFLKKLGYTIDSFLSISGYTLRTRIDRQVNEDRKDSYFAQNFIDYLERKNGVFLEGDTYYGIGIVEKEQTGTHFKQPSNNT